jgi:hypothetical protein
MINGFQRHISPLIQPRRFNLKTPPTEEEKSNLNLLSKDFSCLSVLPANGQALGFEAANPLAN